MAELRDGIEIRLAEAPDIPRIEAIVEAAYSMYLERMDRPPRPMLDDYPARVERGEAYVLAASSGVTGVVVLVSEDGHLLLSNLAVDPEAQGRGFGRRLMDFAEAEATRRGLAEVHLYTNVLMHENLELYARLGYVETSRGDNEGYSVVFMRKPIGAS